MKPPANADERSGSAKGKRDPWFIAFLVLLAAYAVLTAFYFGLVRNPDSLLSVPMSDSVVYLQLGKELATGGPAAHTAFYWSPLYSLLVALFRNAQGMLIGAQMLAGLLTLVLVFLTGCGLGGSRAGFLAALALAFYEPFLMEQSKLVPVTLATLMVVLGVYLAVRARRTPVQKAECRMQTAKSRLNWLLAGLSFGVAGLLMPQLLLVPVLLVAGLLVSGSGRPLRARLVAGIALTAGVVGAVLPVSVRNAVVARDFVPVSSSGGFNLYLGFNPVASGLIARPREMNEFQYQGRVLGSVSDQEEFQRRYAEQELERTLKPSEVSGFWARRAVNYVCAQPGAAAKLVLNKLALSLASYEFANSYYPELERSMAWPLRVTFLPWALLLALGAAGLVWVGQGRIPIAAGTRLQTPDVRGMSLVWAVLVSVAVSLLLFFVNSRYRLPAIPAVCLLVGLGLDRVLTARRRARFWAGVMTGAVLLVLSGVVLRTVFNKAIVLEQAYGWRNFAISAIRLKELGLAGELLDRAARVIGNTESDDLSRTFVTLSGEHVNLHQWQQARGAAEQAVRFNHDAGPAYMLRGVAELGLNRPANALADAEQAIRLAPELANANALKARALLALGRTDDARATVAGALARYPEAEMLRQLAAEMGIGQ
jgi:tetratricopeptide (TPR) repeat protein